MAEAPRSTIVVVDDTEASRYAVSRILRQAHFEVREATTGAEALRLAGEKPDLVVLDVNLPDMSGYDVCRRIKADPATAATPVLHLSASFVQSEDRSEGLECGADGYLTYPLEPRELVAHVEALLRVRRAEKAAREQRELLRVTLSSIGDGVMATDTSGVVTFINVVARALTGWEEDAVGRPLKEVFQTVNERTGEPPDDNPVDRVIRTGKVAGLANHTLLIARDGTRRPIDDTASPILSDGGDFVGVVLVFRDVTERRRLEAELQRRSEDLVDRDRRKDEFLAMLAHELRNPLAPICNIIQVLRLKYGGDSAVGQAGEIMERQLAHLVRLVDDLLDVSRITRGKFELRKVPLELGSVLATTVEGVREFVDRRKHRLEVVPPPGPLYLEADPVRLEQVLSNLLTNAAKYTPPGGHIRLTAERVGAEAVVRVQDNGIGIRPEMLGHVFDLFQQADRVPGRVSEGLGIGLSLVRSLVEMHGGTVSVSSPGPGQGSEFVVRLPAVAGAPPAAGVGEERVAGKNPAGRPLRVLITDDNTDSADSMALLLRIGGHEVRTANDGPEALETARLFLPHVVFLDIALPKGMDGHEVARRLRKEPGLEKVVLIAMTGYGQPEDVTRARAAGMDHHVTKPADPAALLRLLAAVPRPQSPG